MRKFVLCALALSVALLCTLAQRNVAAEEHTGLDVSGGVTWEGVVRAIVEAQDNDVARAGVTDLTLLFALHLNIVADVPFEYGVRVYLAAEEFGLHPYDLAATLISEHSGPDSDFSLFSSVGYQQTFRYKADSLGKFTKEKSKKERGLFQVKPNWVYSANKKLGTNWTKDDLFDPAVNIRIGAFVVSENQASHSKCGDEARSHGLTDTLHSWTGHFKCGSKARDDLYGRCRVAQRKWDKVRGSLVSWYPVNVKRFGSEHNDRVRGILEEYKSASKSALRKKIRKLCSEHELEIPSGLKKMSYIELRNELAYLQESVE